MIKKEKNNVVKKNIFLNTFLDILKQDKTNLNVLKQDKTKMDLKELTISYFKSYISKKENEYQRILKILWIIEKKNKEYFDSSKIKTYSFSDIANILSSLLKRYNMNSVSEKTISRDIKKIEETGLIKSFVKRLGKDNGSFVFYKQNKDIWKYRFSILANYFENKIKDYIKNKRIVSNFKDDIDKISFKSPMSNLPMSSVLYKYKKDNFKLNKNSNKKLISKKNNLCKNFTNKKEIISKKEFNNKKENKFKNDYLKKEKNNYEIKFKKGLFKKSSFKESFKEYQKSKLISKYKVRKEKLEEIEKHSNNEDTAKNAFLNLEKALLKFSYEYDTNDIVNHFTAEFKEKYFKKIWMMNEGSSKQNDFDLIWYGRFTEKYISKFKKMECYNNKMLINYGDDKKHQINKDGIAIEVGSMKSLENITNKIFLDINRGQR